MKIIVKKVINWAAVAEKQYFLRLTDCDVFLGTAGTNGLIQI